MSLTFALQALLNRHEAYMVEAEQERKKMGAFIQKLEGEKKGLQAENAKTIEENRYLLDQLEDINNRVVDSDAQIDSLNVTLHSTRREIERLTILATRASQLELDLVALESEQEVLRNQLVSKEEEGRTAVQRWKGAERVIGTLQGQVDRIEKEMIEERTRHADVLARFERRRTVERELESAAGRLKGAAAATTMERNGGDGNSTVVSHFVKDILQDNANLQMGIVELRDMLMGSNEEVQKLREQIMLHQPVHSNAEGHQEALNSELAKTPTTDGLPDFHVHHHYHAPPTVETKKKAVNRRPKRVRGTSHGLRTPSSGTQTPRSIPASPYLRPSMPSAAAATILSQTSVSIPPPSEPAPSTHSQQCSMQSIQSPLSVATSSLPNSPQSESAFRSLSMFDTIDDAPDFSRPTTPGSTVFGSPMIGARQVKRSSDVPARGLPVPAESNTSHGMSAALQDVETRSHEEKVDTRAPSQTMEHSTILEESEEDHATKSSANDCHLYNHVDDHFTSQPPIRTRLHRANSHDSILSIRNINIPKLRSKPSHMLTSQGFAPRTSQGASPASTAPITSSTSAVVQPSRTARGYSSSNYNRLLLTNNASSNTAIPTEQTTGEKPKFGKRVGGWMFGKWGNMPTPSTGNLKAKDALSAAVGERAQRGKQAENRQSTHIEPVNVDASLLEQSLGEAFEGRSFGT